MADDDDIEEDPETAIANAIWHYCDGWIDCKTNDLEPAAAVIIRYLEDKGWKIVRD